MGLKARYTEYKDRKVKEKNERMWEILFDMSDEDRNKIDIKFIAFIPQYGNSRKNDHEYLDHRHLISHMPIF